jgi:hypothetical protein
MRERRAAALLRLKAGLPDEIVKKMDQNVAQTSSAKTNAKLVP